jgi:glycosyltransferase involved in cell wall biosynthesis
MDNKQDAERKIESTIGLIKSTDLKNQIEAFISKNNLNKIIEVSREVKISLVMLVKNQESVISEVLDRVKNQNLDDCIVVDTGSTDNTKNILKGKDFITLHEIAWVEDYSMMRNNAASFSQTEWILTLDSDELLENRFIDFRLLIYLISQAVSGVFSINFEQHSPGSSSYGVPARLYNAKFTHYFGLVHEELRSNADDKVVPGILTDIKIINQGNSEEEKQKFSKDKRYSDLLFIMMEKEPDNPRWFSLLPSLGIRELVEKCQYDSIAKKYLFKSGSFLLDKHNIIINSYTRAIIQKYVIFLIEKNKIFEAKNLIDFGLKIFPKDIYLMFYQALIQVEEVKKTIKTLLKQNLSLYLSLDKKEMYNYNYTDTQLIEMILAELNNMIGKYDLSKEIIQEVSDKNVLEIWGRWHS